MPRRTPNHARDRAHRNGRCSSAAASGAAMHGRAGRVPVLAAAAVISLCGSWPRQEVATAAPPALSGTQPPVARTIRVAEVDPANKPRVLASAATIDRLIEANYAKHGVTPNPVTTDEQFVRRVYLDITGTIPTYDQVDSFVGSEEPDKRSRLIDRLLDSPGYASHFYNYWADVFRLLERLNEATQSRPYNEWIRIFLEENRPWDEMAFEMVSAEGNVWENPPAGYSIRDAGMPLGAMSNTVRVFLGTQIGCAQCHDHPFDKWRQRDFYGMAAYTIGTDTRRDAAEETARAARLGELTRRLHELDSKFEEPWKYNAFFHASAFVVRDNGYQLKLPRDYQYPDGKPKELVTPKTVFDPQPAASPGEPRRAAFARWLTSPDNPRFALTISNRLWKRTFGVGQIEPVDDLRDDTIAENPELMQFLTAEMIRLDFDMKEYLRILFNTEVYQRQATAEETAAGGSSYHFPGPALRRMTAEQIWDSFVTLIVEDPDGFQVEPAAPQAALVTVDLETVSAEEIMRRHGELVQITGWKARQNRERPYKYDGLLLARAAELPQPPVGQPFLRDFGRSDRESIEASSTDGSVPQALQLMNGPLTRLLLDPRSLLYAKVHAEESVDARLEVIFRSILARQPTSDERKVAAAEVAANGDAGYGDVVWALANTGEFLFVQ